MDCAQPPPLPATISAACRSDQRMRAPRAAYDAGSGVHEATTNWLAMIHSTVTATIWSRFETVRAMDRATISAPQRVYETLTQGRCRSGSPDRAAQ